MVIYGPDVQAAVIRRAEREGLQFHIVSYGGSGTVFLTDWLSKRYRVLTPIWHALINHYAVPIDFGVPRLLLMADPVLAWASVVRRGIAENVSRHIHGGQYGQDHIAGMVEFYNRWTVTEPLIFCKYEVLYDRLDEIGKAMKISFKGFPRKRARRTLEPENVDKRLLELRERFNELPEFWVTSRSQQSSQSGTLVSSAP